MLIFNQVNPFQFFDSSLALCTFLMLVHLYGMPGYLDRILEICQKTNAELLCDLELFYRLNSIDNFFIGITGTNGKSTTTALIGFILKHLEIPSEIGGNIGIPCFEINQNKNFCYAFETSSYQLDLKSA
jgi:UDP-N-acetylmuramoylalanine--D-glutamate ligase